VVRYTAACLFSNFDTMAYDRTAVTPSVLFVVRQQIDNKLYNKSKCLQQFREIEPMEFEPMRVIRRYFITGDSSLACARRQKKRLSC